MEWGKSTFTGVNSTQVTLFRVWCLDIYDWLDPSGTFSGTITSNTGGSSPVTLTADQTNEIGWLMGNATYSNSPATQLAIWQIEYNTDPTDYSNVYGNGTASAVLNWDPISVDSQAASLVSSAISNHSIAQTLTIFTGVDANGQPNQSQGLFGTGGNLPGPTPIPASLPLFLTGLGLMGLLGWKKRRGALPTAAA